MKQEGQIKAQTPRRDFLKVSTAAYAAPIVLNAGRKTFGVSTFGELVGLPEIDTPTWGREPVKVETSRRATTRLNGIWPVFPAINDAHQQPTRDRGYIRVPDRGQEAKNCIPGGTDASVVPGTSKPRWTTCGRQADFHGHRGECRNSTMEVRVGEADKRFLLFGLSWRFFPR